MHGLGALLGSLLGFVAAWTPNVFQLACDHFAHVRDLEKSAQEIDAAKQGLEYAQNQTIDAQTQTIQQLQADVQAARDAAQQSCLLDVVKSSVRPILTYGFFGLFAIIKLVALHHALSVDHVPVMSLLPVLWDEDTESLFAAVITFWFGSRIVPPARAASTPSVRGSSIDGSQRISGE